MPPESHEELKNKILQAIFTYAKGPKIVTNRLCISVSMNIENCIVKTALIISTVSIC